MLLDAVDGFCFLLLFGANLFLLGAESLIPPLHLPHRLKLWPNPSSNDHLCFPSIHRSVWGLSLLSGPAKPLISLGQPCWSCQAGFISLFLFSLCTLHAVPKGKVYYWPDEVCSLSPCRPGEQSVWPLWYPSTCCRHWWKQCVAWSFVRSTFPLLLPHPLAISGTIQQNCLTTANLNIRRTNCNFPERFLLKIGRVFTKILYIPIYSCVHYHQELTIGRTGGLLVALQSRGD